MNSLPFMLLSSYTSPSDKYFYLCQLYTLYEIINRFGNALNFNNKNKYINDKAADTIPPLANSAQKKCNHR